jgi:tetratricopeptide (TPR) repeat protein
MDSRRLEIHVTDFNGLPVKGVIIDSGNRRISAPTDSKGVTYIYPGGNRICVEVARPPKNFVLVSPRDGCLYLNYYERPNLVLARRGDKALLENSQVLVGILSKINSALMSVTGNPQAIKEMRHTALVEQAGIYGFSPQVLDEAIRRRGMKATDPYEKGLIALYKSDYSRASEQLAISLRVRQAEVDKHKEQLLKATLSNGEYLYEKGDYLSAAETFSQALAISPQDPAVLNKLGSALIKTEDYEGAERVLRRALEIGEKISGTDEQLVGEILNNIAELYYTQGRIAEAEVLFERGLVIYEKVRDPDNPRLASNLNNLAALHSDKGELEKAVRLYQRALEVLKKSSGGQRAHTAFVLNNLGSLYLRMGQHLKAEELYRQSLALLESSLGPEHPEVARALDNLGSLYYTAGEYGKAEILLKRALIIRQNASGRDNLDVALSLNNVALVSLAKGNYAEAESLFKQSLAIKEIALTADSPDVAYSLLNLAHLYQANGNYVQAEPLYKRALLVFEKNLGPTHLSVATANKNLAKLYVDEGRYEDAEPLYERSLEIAEKALGPDHPEVAAILEDYAATLQKLNRLNEAFRLKERARLIRSENGKEERVAYIPDTVCNGDSTEVLIKQAWNELNAGKSGQDFKNFEKALACTKVIIDRWANTADEQQSARLKTGQCKIAPSPAERDSFNKSYWALSDVAAAWFIRGQVFSQQKKWIEAREAYKVVVDKYSCAYTWDPSGWFWRTAEGAESELKKIPQ